MYQFFLLITDINFCTMSDSNASIFLKQVQIILSVRPSH